MKIFIELVKITLLLVITIFMGINIGLFQNPVSNGSEPKKPTSRDASNLSLKTEPNQRKADLKKIMEHSLSQIFKFPSSVKFQNTSFKYNRVFHDNGIKVAPDKELEFATYCGQYSAQNAMSVYGSPNSFYAEIAVNNEDKGITGDVWLEIGGEIKKLLSLDSSYTLDADEKEFKKLFDKNCGDTDNAFMGVFNKYEIGYAALTVKYYLEALEKLSQYPEAKSSLTTCSNSGASYDYCIAAETCKKVKDLDKNMNELCSLKKKTCSINDTPAMCEEKLKAVNSSKNQSPEKSANK